MSTWRIDRHYGYGAGHVRVHAEPHRGTRWPVRDGIVTLFFEWIEGGVVATVRRTIAHTPAVLLGLFVITVSAYAILRDYSDNYALEVVMFDGGFRSHEPLDEPIPEELPPPPPPIEVAEVKPEPAKPPEPKPEPVVPKPAPPTPALAERPKPPPPPPAEVKPKARPRPVPVMPQIAKVAPPTPPKPLPVARAERPKRAEPRPTERPRVKIDQLAAKPAAPKPKVERIARASIPLPQMPRNTPKLAAPAAPDLAAAAPPPSRAFRVAKAQPTAGERPRAMPGLAPVPTRPSSPTPEAAPRTQRTAAARPSSARVPRVPQVAPPSIAAANVPSPAPALPRATRDSRPNQRTSERNIPNPVAFASQAVPKPSPPPPKLASRTGRAATGTALSSADERPGVDGVPLGDLAACMSDRDEDRLKQAVVAAVKTQEECVSRKGTYRFVETKNLNAFLMWIDRAPSRAVEDRCAELRYALECLQSGSQRAAR